MFRINEIFYSLQGEGFHTGTPAVFVRFSGCNLRCAFCDTKHQEGKMMSLEEIIAVIDKYPVAPMVILTGGEPSLFIDEAFVATIKEKTGKFVAIETNGTRALPVNLDWVTLSPKTAFHGGNLEPCILKSCDELKVVFQDQELSQYDDIEAKHRFLQPCFSQDTIEFQANMNACVGAVLRHPGWRLSLQVQRTLNIK